MQPPSHSASAFPAAQILDEISKAWDQTLIPQLMQYIKIPNKSPAYDPDWEKNGYMQQAMDLIQAWCEQQPMAGMKIDCLKLPGLTPLLFIEIPGNSDHTVLLYGHMDKQPEMTGWAAHRGPWIPVLQDNKLYGRGAADDGYAIFAALTAIASLQRHHLPHGRCVIIIEASEESGSPDLPIYLKHLESRIGTPELVITLDSDCGNYEQLWNTTSLRGIVSGKLNIQVLTEGIHSGIGGGIVPTCFDVLRQLLDRVHNAVKHEVLVSALDAPEIPKERLQQSQSGAMTLGQEYVQKFPWADQTQPISPDIRELVLNNTWRPALAITGFDGLPAVANAGNVIVPKIAVSLCFRVPPDVNVQAALQAVKKILESDPPHSATVSFDSDHLGAGWNAPALADWLATANEHASQLFYGKSAGYLGCGATIPFMKMLQDHFPQTQFMITGVLGPHSNAHGPNEFLHIPMVKKLTACVASVIHAHYNHSSQPIHDHKQQ